MGETWQPELKHRPSAFDGTEGFPGCETFSAKAGQVLGQWGLGGHPSYVYPLPQCAEVGRRDLCLRLLRLSFLNPSPHTSSSPGRQSSHPFYS